MFKLANHDVTGVSELQALEVTCSSKARDLEERASQKLRAREMGISNIVPTQGDAQSLSYPDGYFDSAYLVATLGEVPDQGCALRELRRVLKRDGRLVVGEVLPDPHRVAFDKLHRLTNAAGLKHERTLKGRLGYFVAFRT